MRKRIEVRRNRITVAQEAFLLRLALAGRKGLAKPVKGGALRSAWLRTAQALARKGLVEVSKGIARASELKSLTRIFKP